ncbi:hypothetical protein NC652_024698 [Populus alba x Populus x berolinensis]|nr:hypothetical protein NC652_024698 [Populus alba x Populus x berolinensis]
MASSSAPYLGVEPEPNITQLCFSICSMILLSGFINKSKHIKTVTVTPTKFTTWIFQSRAILFIFPSTFNIKPSCHMHLQRNCGFAAGKSFFSDSLSCSAKQSYCITPVHVVESQT